MPTCNRSCSSLPSHFCIWTLCLLFYYSARVFFCPLTSIHGQSFARCLLFSSFGLPRFHAVPCWYLSTSIPTLIANVSIHRMVSVYRFGLLFSVRHFISLPPIINPFPHALQILFNIYHKNSKNIVHLLLRFICTRVLC